MILGPLAILLVWTMFAVLFFTSDRTGHTTFSGLSSTRRQSYTVFTAGMFLSGILIFLFIKLWFLKALQLPNLFLYIAGFSTLVLQPIVAFAPYRSEHSKDPHNVAAYVEGMLLPVMAIFIATSPVLTKPAKIACWVLILVMVYLGIEFKRQFLKPKFMLIQAAYTGCFHLTILIATFTAL